MRFQPGYPPVKKFYKILRKGAKATGAARKKAIVAVARQLVVDLWRLNTGRMTPGQLGLNLTEVSVRGEQTEASTERKNR